MKEKGSAKKVRSIAEGQPAAAKPATKSTPMAERIAPVIGKAGPSTVFTSEETKNQNEELKGLANFLWEEHYFRLGDALSDPLSRDIQGESAFLHAERVLLGIVMDTSAGRLREILVDACGQAMLKHFPKDMIGLRHIGNHGMEIGLLEKLKPGERGFTVELPVGTADNWRRTTLTSRIKGGERIVTELRRHADAFWSELAREDEEQYNKKLANMKARTGNLLSVIAAGNGKAVFVIPASKTIPEAYVEIRVKEQQVQALDVLGGAEITKSLRGVKIPLRCVEDGRLTFNARRSLGNRLRSAEYLLAALCQAVRRDEAGRPKLVPGLPAPSKTEDTSTATEVHQQEVPAEPAPVSGPALVDEQQ